MDLNHGQRVTGGAEVDADGDGQANRLVVHVNAASDPSSVQTFTPTTQFPFHTFPPILTANIPDAHKGITSETQVKKVAFLFLIRIKVQHFSPKRAPGGKLISYQQRCTTLLDLAKSLALTAALSLQPP